MTTLTPEMEQKLKVGNIVRLKWKTLDNTPQEIICGIRTHNPGAVYVTDITGETMHIATRQITAVTFTKIKPDIRAALTALFKNDAEKLDLEKQIKALQQELAIRNRQSNQLIENIVKASGVVTPKEIQSRLTIQIPSHSTLSCDCYVHQKNGNVVIKLHLENMLTRYVNPNTHPWIDTEYDNSIVISNHEAAVRDVGIKIAPLYLSKLTDAIARIPGLVLTREIDDIDIGDKDTLIAAKTFVLEIQQKQMQPDFLDQLKPIQEAANLMCRRLDEKHTSQRYFQ